MIYGERIKQLREMHKLTQGALTENIPELKQPGISRIEKGRAEPNEEMVALIAGSTGVTPEFLSRPPVPDLLAHSPQFRARGRLTERSRTAALQWARFIDEQYQELGKRTNSIPLQLKTLHDASPVEAAHEVRSWLGFTPDEPLPYLVLAVEKLGVTVLGLPVQESNLDAFCAWRDGSPIVALLDGVPGDRLRFTLAHELGHLVLHRTGLSGPTLESEADAFAAELLTPLDSIRGDFSSKITLSSLAMLKTRWGVSIRSLVRRARELGIVDQDRATSFYKQISARGWNRAEPGHVPIEKPRAFRKMAEVAFGPGPNVPVMSMRASWSEEMAFAVLDRHATVDELPFIGPSVNRASEGNVVSLESRRMGSRT